MNELRKGNFAAQLHRCFPLPDEFPAQFKSRLLEAVTGDLDAGDFAGETDLSPFIRAGLLTKSGKFSCIASQWYYNRNCFPGRAKEKPESLEELVVSAVGSISAKRLRDTLSDGFPKEAALQHQFNEAFSQHVPIHHVIIPELNTAVQDKNGKLVTGELDFYVHGTLKWAIELLRKGDKIGEHLDRYNLENRTYRTIDMNAHIVVDCRGPRIDNGVQAHESRCTLYFAQDFTSCECQMRTQPSLCTIQLKN